MTSLLPGDRLSRDAANQSKYLSAFLLVYAVCLLFLSPLLPLWVDEIFQLFRVRDHSFGQLIQDVPLDRGGVPLGYITQWLCVQFLSYSVISARLPSILFSIAACYGIAILSRKLLIKNPIVPVILFALLPLQLRYAVEARPYSQALCLSIWSTIAFFHLLERPSARRASLYCICIAAGIYTQPFSVFVPFSHAIWLLGKYANAPRKAVIVWTVTAITTALLIFLPWYAYGSPIWKEMLKTEHYHPISFSTLSVISKELVGAGHIGTAIVTVLAIFGLSIAGQQRSLWCLYVIVPIVLTILADALFGYFFAIRQVIFSLAPLSLLMSAGLQKIGNRSRRVSAALLAGVLTIFLVANINFFRRPREDWDAATKTLYKEAGQDGCILFVPPSSIELYRFFEPEIDRSACPPDADISNGQIAVAISPYGSTKSFDELKRRYALADAPVSAHDFNGPKVFVYKMRKSR